MPNQNPKIFLTLQKHKKLTKKTTKNQSYPAPKTPPSPTRHPLGEVFPENYWDIHHFAINIHMTETNNQNNPINNEQDLEKLILDLKTEIQTKTQEIETWKNGKIKTEQSLFEKEREVSRLHEDISELKRENLRQRRIDLDTKETKQKNDTLALFTQKFQAKMEGAK